MIGLIQGKLLSCYPNKYTNKKGIEVNNYKISIIDETAFRDSDKLQVFTVPYEAVLELGLDSQEKVKSLMNEDIQLVGAWDIFHKKDEKTGFEFIERSFKAEKIKFPPKK